MFYNKSRISFEEIIQIEYVAMLEAVLKDYALFIALESNKLKKHIFVGLN